MAVKSITCPVGSGNLIRHIKGILMQPCPSGFFRDALRTFAGMLSASHWRELPPSLQAVVSDVDGLGTDLGVFLERADLLVTPPEHLWPSAGDYAQALRQGDRASLPKLQLIERADL